MQLTAQLEVRSAKRCQGECGTKMYVLPAGRPLPAVIFRRGPSVLSYRRQPERAIIHFKTTRKPSFACIALLSCGVCLFGFRQWTSAHSYISGIFKSKFLNQAYTNFKIAAVLRSGKHQFTIERSISSEVTGGIDWTSILRDTIKVLPATRSSPS